jgi:integrase/recombinase XerD
MICLFPSSTHVAHRTQPGRGDAADRGGSEPHASHAPDAALRHRHAPTEASLLKVSDIDSQRMVIHIHRGKGLRDRDVPLTPKLLEALREYWRWKKPRVYLFPSKMSAPGVEQPISDKTVWNVCRAAATRAGIHKKLGPHTLRHCFATHLLEAGADLRTIQLLMGHERLEDTTIYLHLSQRHLHAAINPLDQLTFRTAQEQRQG